MDWKPASVESVKGFVQEDLAKCTQTEIALYETYRVDPYLAPINRLGKVEKVVVVARKGTQVIYWEDIEEGFGVSEVDSTGHVTEQDCNQNDLRTALNAWRQKC